MPRYSTLAKHETTISNLHDNSLLFSPIYDAEIGNRVVGFILTDEIEDVLAKLNETPADVVRESLFGPDGFWADEEINAEGDFAKTHTI